MKIRCGGTRPADAIEVDGRVLEAPAVFRLLRDRPDLVECVERAHANPGLVVDAPDREAR